MRMRLEYAPSLPAGRSCYTTGRQKSAIQRLQRLMDCSGTQFPTMALLGLEPQPLDATLPYRHILAGPEYRTEPRVIKHTTRWQCLWLDRDHFG
jgi:hypothetical protein